MLVSPAAKERETDRLPIVIDAVWVKEEEAGSTVTVTAFPIVAVEGETVKLDLRGMAGRVQLVDTLPPVRLVPDVVKEAARAIAFVPSALWEMFPVQRESSCTRLLRVSRMKFLSTRLAPATVRTVWFWLS